MKKLFTLVLALLVATVGYPQVQKVARPDAKKGIATMQKAPRTEAVNENAQSDPVMTSTRGEGELDYTTYDWQTNSGPLTRTTSQTVVPPSAPTTPTPTNGFPAVAASKT